MPKSPNQSLFMKKLSLDNLAHILVLWQTVQDFTYIPFGGFVYGIFVHLATRYTAWKSFQILQASPNNRVLVGKTRFDSLLIDCREVPGFDLWLLYFITVFYVPVFLKV